jgi:hypothetical protein
LPEPGWNGPRRLRAHGANAFWECLIDSPGSSGLREVLVTLTGRTRVFLSASMVASRRCR